jgi:small multidrug resistance family-3 protein
MSLQQTSGLFFLTALMEIVGCFLPTLWLKDRAGAWVLLPAAAALAVFVWLLSLHPAASGRVYAAYGGVYVASAVLWLWLVDGIRPGASDLIGSAVALVGMGIIVMGWRSAA